MRSLVLSGAYSDIRSKGEKLIVRESDGDDFSIAEYEPRNFDFENVVLSNPNGVVTIAAMRWLSRNNIPILFMNFDGELLSVLDMPQTDGKTRLRQYEYYQSKRVEIGKQFIIGKVRHTEDFVNWLSSRYPIDIKRFAFSEAYQKLEDAKTLKSVLGIEGITANTYWSEMTKVFDETKLPRGNRDVGRTNRPMNAIDEVNALLNYGYTYLESLIQKCLIGNGLDPCIGFVH
jgi:CRISPR-associated protein Cas1